MSDRPALAGVRVVVTRAPDQATDFVRALKSEGAEVVFLPTIAIVDPESWEPLDAAIQRLEAGEYSWVLFTSVNAVTRALDRLSNAGSADALGKARVAAVGSRTAEALRSSGVEVDLVPDEFTGEHLVRALGRGGGRVLLPRVEGGPRRLVVTLETAGWAVDEVPAYRNVVAAGDSPQADAVKSGEFDIVTFFSPSAVRNFVEIVGSPGPLGLAPESDAGKLVALLGPTTEAEARELGFRVDLVPEDHTASGLAKAIVDQGRAH